MRIKPKKSLGQNFLIDKNIENKIVDSCGLGADDIVLEIGAGTGILTDRLSAITRHVYAVELDKHLQALLEESLKKHANVSLVKGDILKFDISDFINAKHLKKIKVIGNIPYYISSPIIEHLIKYRQYIDFVYLTVQKEFGRRICAKPGSKEYGSFSCFVQYYAEPKIIFEIKRGSFRPQPNVDSVFLRLKFREVAPVTVKDEELFFKTIRSAFGQRRKTLRNSLQGLVGKDTLENFFRETKIDSNARPETMSLADFALLSKKIEKIS